MPSQELSITPQEGEQKVSAIQGRSMAVANEYRFARFRGRPMVLEEEPYPHFVPLYKERFEQIAYPILGGVSRGQVADVFAYLANVADDLTGNDQYVLFGAGKHGTQVIWDTDKLEILEGGNMDMAIWRSPYGPVPREGKKLEFIMGLAGNDPGLYDDIMQSIAPMIMAKKPDGVVWWIGSGANGKSTLMDAIHRVFPGQLSSLTVKQLTDERDTPSLNGTLANIVKESSEGRVDDTHIYKSIGTHEDFSVHKFHSQDSITIRGNMHHIFSGNSIPTFNDKGHSARRRTFIVPFNQEFASDPSFEERTFTPEFFGLLVQEMMIYAQRLRDQGYKYKWSATTLGAKADYDRTANNAEEYARVMIADGITGFDGFNPVRMDYETWCSDNGYVPLGVANLRKAVLALGFERLSFRGAEGTGKIYRLPYVEADALKPFGMGRPGLYTVSGFERPDDDEEKPAVVPEFDEEIKEDEAPKQTILGSKW